MPQDMLFDPTAATSQDEEVQTTEQTPGNDTQANDSTDDAGNGETTSAQTTEETAITDNLTKLADGSFRYVVDPSDPNSTVYKGKDEKELWGNVTNGFKAKDAYIRGVKTSGIAAKQPVVATPPAAPEIPNESEIAEAMAKSRGLDPKYLAFTDEDWRNYELDHGGYLTTKQSMLAEAIKNSASQEANARTVEVINHRQLDDEVKDLPELCDSFGVDVDEIDWDAIFKKIQSNPSKYYRTDGTIRAGAFTREASLSILAASTAKQQQGGKTTKEAVEKKIQEAILAKREEKKAAATTTTHQTREVTSVSEEAFESLDQLNASLKKELARNGEK